MFLLSGAGYISSEAVPDEYVTGRSKPASFTRSSREHTRDSTVDSEGNVELAPCHLHDSGSLRRSMSDRKSPETVLRLPAPHNAVGETRKSDSHAQIQVQGPSSPHIVVEAPNPTQKIAVADRGGCVTGGTCLRINKMSDVKNLPLPFSKEDGVSSKPEVMWDACLWPFLGYYSILIFNHRQRMGHLYSFKPTFWDWLKSCVCPCYIVYHNELYIVKAEATREAGEKMAEQYKSHPPMSQHLTVTPERVQEHVTSPILGRVRSPELFPSCPCPDQAPRSPNILPSIPEREGSWPILPESAVGLALVGSDSNVREATSPKPALAPVKYTSIGNSTKQKDPPRINSDHVPGRDELPHDMSSPSSISPLELHGLHSDPVAPTAIMEPKAHRLSDDIASSNINQPTRLHALHLDPVIPAGSVQRQIQMPRKVLSMPKAAQPLAPKIHRLSQDIDPSTAPGAFPPASPPPPRLPALRVHDLETDIRVNTALSERQDHRKKGHDLSEDVNVAADASGGRTGTPSTTLPAHELGAILDEQTIPVREQGLTSTV